MTSMKERSGAGRLRVGFVCSDLGAGGAARATLRIARALQAHTEGVVDLRAFTAHPTRFPEFGSQGLPGGASRIRRVISRRKSRLADQLPWSTPNAIIHSRADIWTGMQRSIGSWPPDVIHLHWLGPATMSIEEVGAIPYPVVWTLHDMWVILGAEHVAYDERYTGGYARGTRPDGETGIDWNRRTWRRKRAHWGRRMHLVAPSRWLTDQARRSPLAQQWEVTTIPNPVDTGFWRALDRNSSREALGLPRDRLLLLTSIPRGMSQVKGLDLLRAALGRLARDERMPAHPPELILIGSGRSDETGFAPGPFRMHDLGEVRDDRLLRLVYSAADATLVPSRIESFSQVAAESLACGTPVVAFGVGGLLDVVRDFETGRLVQPESPEAFAAATADVLLLEGAARRKMGALGASDVADRFSPAVVAQRYATVYRNAISRHSR